MAMDMTTALTIKANVVGQGQITGLQTGLKKVTGQTNRAAGAMGRLKAAAGGALGAMGRFLPVLGVGAIGAFAKKSIDAADSMSKLSQRTGIAAPALDKFRQAAELSDTSIDSLEKAFPKLARGIDDAIVKGTGPAADAFGRLGVSVTDANGKVRETDQVMLDLADKFQQMPDGTEKAALASQIFGERLGSELIPMLNMGGDAVRGMSTALTQEFADKAAGFNDKITMMGEKLGQLGMKITEALLPFLTQLVDGITFLAEKFAGLPTPIQAIIVALGGIAAAALVFAPIVSAVTTLGPLLVGLATGIGSVVTTLGTMLPALAAVFTGPVGWVALAVAAGAAVFTFRDQIGEAFGAIGETIQNTVSAFNEVFVQPLIEGVQTVYDNLSETFSAIGETLQTAATSFYETFVQPLIDGGQAVYDGLVNTLSQIGDALRGPFEAAASMVRGVINGILNGVGNAIKSVVSAINNIIAGANKALAKLGLPQIPFLPSPEIPQFAKGGMVTGPTLGLVGEAGPEYIVPARKAMGFAQNIMNGVRGPGAIPRFAEGGFVAPASANVNIQTGPVTQMNGENFVTTNEMSKAVRAGVQQTLDILRRDGNTRAALGLS